MVLQGPTETGKRIFAEPRTAVSMNPKDPGGRSALVDERWAAVECCLSAGGGDPWREMMSLLDQIAAGMPPDRRESYAPHLAGP